MDDLRTRQQETYVRIVEQVAHLASQWVSNLPYLLPLHAMAECDTVASMYGVWKGRGSSLHICLQAGPTVQPSYNTWFLDAQCSSRGYKNLYFLLWTEKTRYNVIFEIKCLEGPRLVNPCCVYLPNSKCSTYRKCIWGTFLQSPSPIFDKTSCYGLWPITSRSYKSRMAKTSWCPVVPTTLPDSWTLLTFVMITIDTSIFGAVKLCLDRILGGSFSLRIGNFTRLLGI